MALLDTRRLRSGRLVRTFAPDPLVAALRFAWVTLIIWGEIGVFFYALSGCRWPMPAFATSAQDTTRILLIADAQVPAPPPDGRSLSGVFRGMYMRRAWAVTRRLRPQMVFFLGDMLTHGRAIESDEEFARYVQHFHDFFPLDDGVEARYIPGNADVGLGVSNAFSKHVRQRYERYFGRVNQYLSVANHSLVLLDAPGIVDEDYNRVGHSTSFEEWIPMRDGAIEFVKGLAADGQHDPVILFSHIPLHRAESKGCGPLRERGTIHRGVGHGWQKTLGKQTSQFLLESLRPVAVFSADDRDYCDVTHALPAIAEGRTTAIHEITVKSYSPARHISQPGLHLLSLSSVTGTHAHAHAPCALPRASGTPTRLYVPAACTTVLLLLVAHARRAAAAARLRLATASPLPSHADLAALAAPSPYSASSAYSYSYAYSNTPPRRDAPRIVLSPPRVAPPPPEDDDGDGVRAHYLFTPAPAPAPADPLTRRARASPGADADGSGGAATGPAPRAWAFSYAFTFRGRRRRVALRAPAWWPRPARRRRSALWGAVARDVGRVAGPAGAVWAVLAWWYSR
ncbi:hypothetical protein BC834DRAFT_973154 [Gloeopeniophorella convolvens]|nr:hypothetical protein BC834DRAFT_973154 [Gloeopeniophorella convolvens]